MYIRVLTNRSLLLHTFKQYFPAKAPRDYLGNQGTKILRRMNTRKLQKLYQLHLTLMPSYRAFFTSYWKIKHLLPSSLYAKNFC